MGLTVMKMFIHNLILWLYVCRERSFFSFWLTARVEYFAIIGSRLIAECFPFIFQSNLTAADIKKFRVSAYSLGRLIGE